MTLLEQSSDVSESRMPRDKRVSRPSQMAPSDLFKYLQREFRQDAQHSARWRRDAKEAFDFRAGEQWTPEEKSQLKEQLRPEIVFNRALTIIKAVAGFEINSRHEIQFLPRNTTETAVNEVITQASKWMAQECDGEDEESEMFDHAVTTGMGWCEHRVDFEIDSKGQYIESVVDPLEMYWDRKARKKNLIDSRRMWRLRKMALTDAMDLCPGHDEIELDARWAVGLNPEEETKTLEEKRRREENAADNFTDQLEVHILHAQWWEREPYWLVADPVTNERRELSEEEYAALQKRLKLYKTMEIEAPPFKAVKMMRRVYKQCFVGAKILGEVTDVIMPTLEGERPFQGFTWTCVTGEPHHNRGTWFGLIAIMKDPAKWSNKWLSQTMHILNSQAKGGIMVEEDFAADIREFELGYAKPQSVTKVKKGALSRENGPKFVAKPTAQFPQGFYQLLEFAISSLRDVTGINLELLGQQDQNQPGILEAQRKQAGMTVLATMFDSLRRARKLIGRIRLFFIQNYISDGRIMRVTGPDGAQAVPLLRDLCLGEYDVVMDDAPTSPNQKEASWAVIAPMLPLFKDELASNPKLLVSLLEYSPLPNKVVQMLTQLINQPPSAEQQAAAQYAVQKVVAAINKDQSIAEMNNAKAGATQATATYDIAMAQHIMNRDQAPEGDPLQQHLDAVHKAAQIHTENAKRAQIEAQTSATQAQTDATRAQIPGHHAKTAADRVRAMIDALTPIPHAPSMQGVPNG
ncbi:MAG TPA: hypothetical protein VEU47_13455 [Candidatus Cybelea sp.]|nr:hypothetical protein [Candidatus Cybelea sp.]